MKKLLLLFALLFAISTAFVSCRETEEEQEVIEETAEDVEDAADEMEDEY